MKYKVGDRVLVIKDFKWKNHWGTIIRVEGGVLPYRVIFNTSINGWSHEWFTDDEIELEKGHTVLQLIRELNGEV